MYPILLKGVIIGLVVAVPVGPIGLLCINRGLNGGAAYGFSSWLGVAAGDALVGGIAALGVTLISNLLLNQHAWLHFIAGVFLCYFGLRTFVARPTGRPAAARGAGFLGGYASTFFLTVTNPATFASFFAIYAGWGMPILREQYFLALILAAAIFIGTAVWWLLLGAILLFYCHRFSESVLRSVHRVSGAIIAGFGFILLVWF